MRKKSRRNIIIKGKLQEKDEEFVRLKKEHELTNDAFAAL